MNEARLDEDYTDERPKLLSVVMGARNDQYMGNFMYRVTTALNYMARNLRALGRLDDVEILITDWGSEIPLSEVLGLSSAAAEICRFIYVPREVTLSVQPDGAYHSIVPINAALRRGTGKFLGLFDSDSLYQTRSLETLLDLLDGRLDVPFDIHRALYVLGRFRIPREIVLTEPSLEELDRFLLLSAASLPKETTAGGLGTSTSLHIMSRSLWLEHRGYDERLGAWGWSDGELGLRVTQVCPWVDLLCFGILAYHMDHGSPGQLPPYDSRNPDNVVSMSTYVNDENWGLGNLNLETRSCANVVEPASRTRPDSTVGSLAEWNLMPGQLIRQISNEKVLRHAEQTMAKLEAFSADWEVLSIASWYGLYHYPRVLLDFGAMDVGPAVATYLSCPSVEIYGIDPLQNLENIPIEKVPFHDVRLVTLHGHAGYRRLITGDPATAFHRLKESFVGPFAIDLAIFRPDLFKERAVDELSKVISHLIPGGAVCLAGRSTAQFSELWREIREKFPHLTFLRCISGKTGLLISARLAGDAENGTQAPSDETVLDLGKPQLVNRSLIWQIMRKLSRPAKYPDYVRQIGRMISSP